MSRPLQVVVFAEGQQGQRARSGHDWFEKLWTEAMVDTLGLRAIQRVEPFHKGNLAAMTDPNPRVERLDVIIAKALAAQPFDAAVVVWDLQPAWTQDDGLCMWKEKLKFYGSLSQSRVLPGPWKAHATARFQDLNTRKPSSSRRAPPRLVGGAILAACVEPEFESVLLCESGVRQVLGATGKNVRAWPKNWKNVRKPKDFLGRAISAVRGMPKPPKEAWHVSGDMITAHHEWAHHFIAHGNPALRKFIREHGLGVRLQELLGR